MADNNQEAPSQVPSPKKKSLIDWFLGKKTEEELKAVETASSYKPLFKIDFPNEIPVLPEPKDITKIDVRYKVIEPFVNIHIYWDAPNNELAYEVEEPKLTEQEVKDLRLIEEGLTELINISYINIEDMNIVVEFLEKNLKILLDEFGIKVSEDTFLKYMYFLYRDLIGMNQVEPLLRDYFIEDIECNGFSTPIYIVHRKYRNLRTNIAFPDIRTLASFVEKLAQKCSQYVSYANPLLDGTLPDGSRVNATYTEDVTSRGPTFCITEGKIQLSNGIVGDIRELFNECKEKFGCSEAEGDEIVELKDIKACGVKAENLKQIQVDVKTIMKLKPPERLVHVEVEDGGSINVTPNHLFHAVDDMMELVQAKDLKKGMFIPIPSKIEVAGKRQCIDTGALLRAFSKEKKVCIVSTEAVKSLVSTAVGYGKYCKNAEEYGVHESYFYDVTSRGCSISFNVLDRVCNQSNTDIDSLGEISIVVYGGGSRGKPKAVKLPSVVDDDLAYLAGAVISDGHLSRANIDVSCYEEGTREAVKSALISKFGNCESYYNGNRVYMCNLFVPYFFNKVFEIPFGKKSGIVKVPEIIFKSDDKVVAAFIRGLFDGDGTCSSGVSYKTNSKQLAEGLSYLLARMGIYCYINEKEGQYKVTIPSIYEVNYCERIGFKNNFKAKQMRALLGKKYSESKSYINHGRVPAKPVLSLMKEMGISKKFIAKESGVSYNRLMYYDSLAKPFANRIAEIIEKEAVSGKIKIKLSQLMKLNYIKWLASNNYEYVKVKDAKEYENAGKLNVYDVELEPSKFFIGGNKPMVLFDTIRKFTKEPWTPIKLMDFKTVSPEILAYIWLLIENKSNILVIGGTGSGKTSFLNAIAFFIPPAARIVSIEDTRELNLRHENWLPAVSRAGAGTATITGEKHGEVSLFDLLKESLRQRPDYIIVGEIRGKEAFVLFQGMNTGHPSFGTMHAESTDTVIKRLTMPPISLSPSMVEALDALCIITPAKVGGKDVRRISRIDELVSVDEKGNSKINVPFVRDPAKDVFMFKTGSKVFEKIMKRTGMQWKDLLKEFENRTRLLMELYRRKIFGFAEVQDIIHEYYKRPENVLKRFGLVKEAVSSK